MNTKLKALCAAFLACAATLPAQAANLDLSTYTVKTAKQFVGNPGSNMSEAGAITYNEDRNSLLVIGDEGAINEYNLNGDPLAGTYRWLGASAFQDPEGVTYIGNGQFVTVEERTTNLWLSNVVSQGEDQTYGTQWNLGGKTSGKSYQISPTNFGNLGIEGISYDPLTGGIFAVKQDAPQTVYFVDVDMNAPENGSHFEIFGTAGLGLTSLSDIATLSTVASFEGSSFASNLLILSATSESLIEVDRQGNVLSSFDLSNIFSATNGQRITTIEGVTVDNAGNIYLAAEGAGDSLIVLQRNPLAAIPEPATWAMMIAGFGMMGAAARRRVRAQHGLA